MNQMVLLFTAIAFVAGAFAVTQSGESNAVWVIFFASAAAAFYFYWKNRGEGQGSSRDHKPTSSGSSMTGSSSTGTASTGGSERSESSVSRSVERE